MTAEKWLGAGDEELRVLAHEEGAASAVPCQGNNARHGLPGGRFNVGSNLYLPGANTIEWPLMQ